MENRKTNDGPGFQSESLPDEPGEDGEMALPETPCVTHPEYFYGQSIGPDGFPDERLETNDERSQRILKAKKLCLNECPYRFGCLMLSLRRKEKWGIWGGWQRTDRRDFKNYLLASGFSGYPENDNELEWEARFFEGTDAEQNGHGPRPITFKYGVSGLEDPLGGSLPEEDDDEANN